MNEAPPSIKQVPPFLHTSAKAPGHDSTVGPDVVATVVVAVVVVVVVVGVANNGMSQKKPVNPAEHVPISWILIEFYINVYKLRCSLHLISFPLISRQRAPFWQTPVNGHGTNDGVAVTVVVVVVVVVNLVVVVVVVVDVVVVVVVVVDVEVVVVLVVVVVVVDVDIVVVGIVVKVDRSQNVPVNWAMQLPNIRIKL